MRAHSENPSDRELADLSALADGTLDPARRNEVQARIAASPELTALYERERHVVGLLHHSAGTVRAPAALRRQIETQRPSRPVRARRRVVYGGTLAGALAAVAVALALVLPGGTPGAPSVSEAAALAVRGAAAPAPAPEAGSGKLATSVEDVYFPNWADRFGWRATGMRTDRINGRRAVTVYYDWHGRRLAYTIVSAPALATPPAAVTTLRGTEYRTLTLNGRLVVTWPRANHTCIISATGVPIGVLQRLASSEA